MEESNEAIERMNDKYSRLNRWIQGFEEDFRKEVLKKISINIPSSDDRGARAQRLRVSSDDRSARVQWLRVYAMKIAWDWKRKTESPERELTTRYIDTKDGWNKLGKACLDRIAKVSVDRKTFKLADMIRAPYYFQGRRAAIEMQRLVRECPALRRLDPTDRHQIGTSMDEWLEYDGFYTVGDRLAHMRVLLYMFGVRFAHRVLKRFHVQNQNSPVHTISDHEQTLAYIDRYNKMCILWQEANWLNELSRITTTSTTTNNSDQTEQEEEEELTSGGGMAVEAASLAPVVNGADPDARGGHSISPVLMSMT
jgi:hypothetical protein